MKFILLLLTFLQLYWLYVDADKIVKNAHAQDGKKARKEIGAITKEMQSTMILQKKATQLKRSAIKQNKACQAKRSPKLQLARKIEKLAVTKKKKAVNAAKQAVDKNPLEAIKSLRKLKKSKSPLKKKSAQFLAKEVAKQHKIENKAIDKATGRMSSVKETGPTDPLKTTI